MKPLFPGIDSIYQLISNTNEKVGNNIFLSTKNNLDEIEILTYSELLILIDKFHSYFESNDIKTGQKISVAYHNSGILAVLFLCITASGRVFVPLNPNSTIFEMEYILEDSESCMLFDGTNISKGFSQNIQDKICVIDLNALNDLLKFLENYEDKKAVDSILPLAEAEIVYTSGTTGRPKGVVLTHENLLADSFAISKSFSFNENDKFLTICPLFHNSGQISTTLGAIWVGATTTPVRAEFGLINFWNYIHQYNITWTLGMPTHINFLLERQNLKNNYVKSNNTLKGIFCGGAKLEKEKQLQFENIFNTPVYTNYGLTETTSFATCTPLNMSQSALGSVGVPLFINDIKIVNSENSLCNVNEEGEIFIKGINLFKHYINKKEITDSKFVDGWFKTGDLGYFNKDNFLFIVDRIDNMILVGGENVYPADIENHISTLINVAEAVITSIPHKILGNEIVLVYRLIEGKKEDVNKWIQALSKFVVKFKLPNQFLNIRELNISEIPKAPNGKILRHNLKVIVNQHYNK
jgi:acyl-CoA synthetase (AMP-forming)/AMP-acid ligase II